MGTFRPSSIFSSVISKAMVLLAFALGGSDVFAQIAQRGTATSATSTTTSVTVDKPLGLTVGDVMLATINQADNDGNTLANATSTGWTLVDGAKYYETGNDEWWGTVLYKVADATDIAAANFSFTGDGDADDMQASIIAFSGVDPSNPIDVAGAFTSSSTDNTSLSANAVTTSTSNAAVIMLAMISDDRNFNGDWNTTSPGSLTEFIDVPFNADLDMGIAGAWAIKSSAGSTGNGTVTLSGNARDGAILIALRRAAIPGSTLTTTFTSNGTFTVPNCVTNLTVEAWGGGGAGGGVTGNVASGGGGKGGSYVKNVDLSVSGNQTYTVTVGSGGTGGTGNGSSGGSSSFVNSGLSVNILAAGGAGGNAGSSNASDGSGATATNGTNSGFTSTFSYNGGNGANGSRSNNRGGGGGSSAGTGQNGNNASNQTGGTAPTGGGAGGNGFTGTGNEGNGNSATQIGGGGGGAVTDDNSDYSGGNGANGMVTVTYAVPNNPTITLTNTTATSCFSAAAQNVTLAYSTTTGCPDRYSVDFATGITDVIDANLSGSPITIALPANLAAGTYTGTLTVRNSTFGFVSSGYSITITVTAAPNAPTGSGASRCGTGTVVLNATPPAGAVIDWYAAATGGSPLAGGTGTSSFTTPSISSTTTYYAASRNTTTGCSSTRAAVVASINPLPTGVAASVSPTTVCAGQPVALSSSAASNSASSFTMLSENFNAANPAWTAINNSTGGTPANAAWTIRANNYNNGAETIVTNDASSFMFSDSDAQGSGSSTNTSLVSPAFSTVGVAAANINLNHYFRFNASPDQAFVEASVDGATWLTLQSYTSTQGARDAFSNATIPLTAACLNQPTVYIRFRYICDWGWYWAINNVTVTASSTAAAFSWTSSPAGYTSNLEDPTGVTPGVNTTYTVTATNNYGCSASATTASVTVNAAPVAPTSAGNSRCGAGTVTLTASVAAGVTVDWYAAAAGGSPLAGGTGTTTFTTPNISTTTTYYAQARNTTGGCFSPTRTAVVATINQTPAITSPFTGKGCTGIAFNATPVNVDDGVVPAGTTYTWAAPTGTGFTGGSAQNTPQSSISQTLTLTGASAAVASYTVTPSVGGCTGATFTANITINPNPTVTISADYCSVGGTAVLSATAGLSSYTWSTGTTGATLNATQAGSYSVTASNAQGCSATASIGVATELVTNGNFNAGNTGFVTGYTFVADGPGNTELVPEGTYSVATNANNLHSAFNGTGFGGSGNFMIINGSPTITTIWSQNNIAVQPNTTYYFSAWGLTLVNGNNAALQFSINGSQVGSIAYLPNGTTSAPYPWERFYGQWNSGNNTSVDLSIVNLQLALGGNDFGLDNISFGTFSPIALAVTPGANSSSAVCQGSEFYLNANPDGGASPYSYAWTGPNGFTSTQENPVVTNSASTAINGTYNLTITDGLGCVQNGSTTVSVSSLPNVLTPVAQAATVCAGIATNINIPTSQEDVGYTLYDSATNQPVSATLPGNLGTLSLSTDVLNSTTTFYVVAQRYATGCSRTLTPNVTITVATTPVLVTNNIALCTGTADLTAAAVTAGSTGGGTLSYWTNATATTAVANAAAVTAGTYYIKAVVGSCEDIEPVNVVISGTPVTTFNYTGSPFCNNGTNPVPTYSSGGTAGVYSASPAGLAFVSTSTGVIDLAASAAGTYTVTNTITPVGACTASSTNRTITVTAAPDPTFSYASNGFCQAVGANNPVPVFQNGAQAGVFSSSAISGLSFVSTATGEVDLGACTPGSYAIINTIAATAGCASVADTVFVDINPYTFTSAINVSASDDQLCLGESVNFYASGTSYSTVLEREDFEGTFTPWTTTNLSSGGSATNARWRLRQSPYNYNSNNYSSNDASQFYISNSQDQGGGTTNTILKSPVMNTVGFTTLSLSFYQFYDDRGTADDVASVQVSTNNTTWTNLIAYDSDQGSRTNFSNAVINMNAYVGLPSVWIRFQYSATNDRAWAIDNVTISGNSTRYTYNWSSVPIAFSSTQQNPAGYAPTASAYYDVEALNVYGCTSNTSPIPVIVNPLPEDNAGANLDLCANTSGTIGLASQSGRTYSWSPTTGLSDAAIANPTATPSASNTYTLTETITATGCSDTNNVFVNIRPVSVINNMTAQLCSGGAFTASPVNGTNGTVLSGTTYVWSAPTGAGFTGGSAQAVAQNSISQTLSASAAATATYAVTPKVNGCDGAAFDVEVAISPESDAGAINGATSVCVDVNSANLSVSGNVGDLQWQSSSNNVSFTDIAGETGTSYTATNLSATTFYRVVATSGVCPADNGSSAQISMLSRPTAALSGSADICAGLSTSLNLALTGNGPWSGTLSNGQSFSAASSPAIISVAPSANTTYSVSALSDANCAANGGLNGSAVINVNALPTASITGSATICGGSSGTVTINGPANGEVAYTLNGNEQDITLNGSGVGTINTGNIYQNLTYSLVEVEDGLCENTATGTATITYQEAPDATISGSTQVCSGQSTAIAFSGNANAVITYNVNGGGSQTVTLNGSGNGSINTGNLSATTTYNLVSVAVGSCSSVIGTSAVVNVGLTVYYQDSDGDGYGNAAASTVACTQPTGYVTNDDDCCDTNADINPSCEWWADMDNDGYGSFIYDIGCIAGVSCSPASWPAQLIPYCPLVHGGTPYALDCNDNSAAINAGAAEICNNTIDDDCDGLIGEGCSGQFFDQWNTAQVLNVNNTNAYYPACQTFSGTIVNTDISPQGNPANVAAGGGRDTWYRFVAPSTGVRIRVTANGFNPVIELQNSSAVQLDAENVNPAVGGTEILNYGNLTVGQTYYVGVRNYEATNVGTYTICISPLMPSGCASSAVGGFNLCDGYKAVYRAATSYTFNFTGVGGNAVTPFATTSITTANGIAVLSNPSLGIRYGGIYNVRVDANYMLPNGLGTPEPMITVLGNAIPANCTGVLINQQPVIEVRANQICPAVITRTTYLYGNPAASNPNICGHLNFTFEFTRVTDCTGNTVIGSPITSNTTGALCAIALNSVFTSPLTNIGYWKVRIRPNFSSGAGAWGDYKVIAVSGTAAGIMQNEGNANEGSKTLIVQPLSVVYPNPNNGNEVQINLTDIGSGDLTVKIVDALGRAIFNNRYSVEGSLFTKINFEEQLSGGIYLVEFTINGESMSERMIVEP
ncbi:MAG: PKD-like domain-containing protein [Flavobacteriales bacterium]